MTRLLGAAALALPLLTAGCGGSAELMQALAADKNADCLHITTPLGSTVFDRNWGCEAPPARAAAP